MASPAEDLADALVNDCPVALSESQEQDLRKYLADVLADLIVEDEEGDEGADAR